MRGRPAQMAAAYPREYEHAVLHSDKEAETGIAAIVERGAGGRPPGVSPGPVRLVRGADGVWRVTQECSCAAMGGSGC
nr:hypothetical protein [Micromonospora sp. DSM 115978]